MSFSITGLNQKTSLLQTARYQEAARSAFAGAQAATVTHAAALVANRYTLAPSKILSAGQPIIAPAAIGANGLTGGIATSRGGISLTNFSYSRTQIQTSSNRRAAATNPRNRNRNRQQPGNQRRTGVSVSIIKGKTTQLRQFMATGRNSSGSPGIYRRAGRARLPIIQSAVSPASLLRANPVSRPLSAYFVQQINSIFAKNLKGATP